jgi:hypothetical protein
MRRVAMAGAVLLVSTTAFAQDEAARKAAVEVAARVPFEKSMKGAPYSAETVIESSQTLVDGNRINRKTTGRVYRDGEGRTRREDDREFSALGPNGPVAGRMTSISIVDPVAGFSYSLDPENKIAWRTPVGAAANIVGKVEAAAVEERRKQEAEKMASLSDEDKAKLKAKIVEEAAQAGAEREKMAMPAVAGGAGGRGVMIARGGTPAGGGAVTAGPLEHKVIEGIAVDGRKTTTTIPAGTIGNEQPIVITSEEWRSPDLNVLVMTKHADPRTGESTYRLQNIVRAEPDRSLFMVPADYQVKDTNIRRMEARR